MAAMPTAILNEGFTVIAEVGGPVMGALLAVGLLVGILQAATQINDPAVGFLPRVVAGIATVALLGGWMIERLARYLASALTRMGGGPL